MIPTEENRSTWGKPRSRASLSTTNPTLTEQGIGCEASAVKESANRLIHGRTLLFFISQYNGQARWATRKRGFLSEAEKQQCSSQQDS